MVMAKGLALAAASFGVWRFPPIVNLMTRRNALGPSLEIVPRDRSVGPVDLHGLDDSVKVQQIGPRLQKIYAPCSEHQLEMDTLIEALDRKL